MNEELTVIRSNELVQSSYKLTLDERRLIECCIANITSGQSTPSTIKITAKEYGKAFGLSDKHAYEQLQAARQNLWEREIKIYDPEKDENHVFRWIQHCSYQTGLGYITMSFSDMIKPYLNQLKENYTSYRLLEIKHLKSSHSIRMYELMMQYKKTGFRVDTVENLKEYFGVSDKYKRWADFNNWVIKKSVKDINERTAYQLKCEPVRKGRKIHAVKFVFAPKSQMLLDL